MIYNSQIYNLEEELLKKTKPRQKTPSPKNNDNHTQSQSEITQNILINIITKTTARLLLYAADTVQEVHFLQNEVAPPSNETTEEKVQIHRIDQLQKHFKEAADNLYSHITNDNNLSLIVIGHEEITTKKFIDFLHDEVKNRIIASAYINPDRLSDPSTISQIVTHALEKQQLEADEETVQNLARLKGQGKLTDGLEQVLKAMNRGLAHTLFINGDATKEGFMCKTDSNLSLVERNCPICSQKQEKIADIFEEVIKIAKKNNFELYILKNKPEVMEKYQNIAAMIYS